MINECSKIIEAIFQMQIKALAPSLPSCSKTTPARRGASNKQNLKKDFALMSFQLNKAIYGSLS